jgi:dephospho-CoA kinase
MKWIGITGGIATGKSTVTKRLRTLGYEVLDADDISHQVTSAQGRALPQIFTVFGEGVRSPDGSLDRKALGALVFGREEQRKKLEAIIHPLVRQQIADEKARLLKAGTKVVFYDVPLLFENAMEKDFDAVLLVSTTPELQLERLMKRNSLNDSEAKARVQSQMALSEKQKKTPYIIDNSKDLAHLENEIDRVLRELKV